MVVAHTPSIFSPEKSRHFLVDKNYAEIRRAPADKFFARNVVFRGKTSEEADAAKCRKKG
jgi:hypothetical protein